MRIDENYLFNAVRLLIHLFAKSEREKDEQIQNRQFINSTNKSNEEGKIYDFIVVGAGSAGCVVASRLSEKYSVLLLETGGPPPPQSDIPLYYNLIMTQSTGKMMGGSGTHNGLVHNRGNPKDFDNWAKITNDSSWKYENLVKYFKRTEDFIGKRYGNESEVEFYGKGGPIQVETVEVPLLPIWFDAARELGYEIGDSNGFQRESFTAINAAIRNGKRSSSYTEYIRPFENKRANLTIIKYANVSQILLNDSNHAYGVSYTRHNGSPIKVFASKEVIISAGTYSSPLLLMKSGIGPTKILNEANIPVKVPLESVGKNLGEHAMLVLTPFSFDANYTHRFERVEEGKTHVDLESEWNAIGMGVLRSIANGPQSFIVSSKTEKDWPDLFIKFHPIIGYGEGRPKGYFDIMLGRPKSTGLVSLNSSAYKEGVRGDTKLALIDFKILENARDRDAIVEGIKFAFRISETEAFKKLGIRYEAEYPLKCQGHVFKSDDYWKCYIEQYARVNVHMVGTCSLGPDAGDPNTSVVDPKFRVRGTTGLRVIDASVMPVIPNPNINAAVLMLAEKAVDDIKEFWTNFS